MKWIAGIIAILFLATNCNKVSNSYDPNDDFKDTGVLMGRLGYIDAYAGNGTEQPLGNQKVYLAYSPSDTTNYLYYAITDAGGNFLFNNLYSHRKYDVFYGDSINSVLFSAFATTEGSNRSLHLLASNDTLAQSGLFLTVTDASGQPFNMASVCLFNSLQQYQADTCLGSILSKPTDSYGRAIFYNLLPGDYYLRIRGQAGNTYLQGDTTFTYTPKGIRAVTAILRPATEAKNGIEVRTLDMADHPLPNVPVCLFNNPTLFSADTCAGSIASTVTDGNGVQYFNYLPAGTYYLLSKVKYANLAYKGTATVEVDGVSSKVVVIHLQ